MQNSNFHQFSTKAPGKGENNLTFNFSFCCQGNQEIPQINQTNQKLFHFARLNGLISSIRIPVTEPLTSEPYVETGPITLNRINPSNLGALPPSMLDFKSNESIVTWPASISFPLLRNNGIPSLNLLFTGVGKMDLNNNEMLFVDVAQFDLPEMVAPDGITVSGKKRVTIVNKNIIVVSAPTDIPIPNIPDSSQNSSILATFGDINSSQLSTRFPVEKMMKQAFAFSGVAAKECLIEAFVKEFQQNPDKELQIYFPNQEKFQSASLNGEVELKFINFPS